MRNDARGGTYAWSTSGARRARTRQSSGHEIHLPDAGRACNEPVIGVGGCQCAAVEDCGLRLEMQSRIRFPVVVVQPIQEQSS